MPVDLLHPNAGALVVQPNKRQQQRPR
jgi:hypothetical protein